MKFIGAHVSASGGLRNAPRNAAAAGASAFALFTKNQRQWNAPPITESEAEQFRAGCLAAGISPEMILPHDSYLINMGNPDANKRAAALTAFVSELRRCAALGLDKLNFHPGSHLNQVDMDTDLRLIAACVREALDEVPGVAAVYENAAGQGSNAGFELEQLAALLEYTGRPGRCGVCIDSCHAFAAGYDLRTSESTAAFFEKFSSVIGFEYLRGMHLNDSHGGLNSRLDRHECLGKGEIGLDFFRFVMEDERFDGIPLILETPEPEHWADEISLLRSFERA